MIEEHFGDLASRASGAIVFRAESGVHDPQMRAAIEQMLEEVAAIEGVTLTSPYAPEAVHQSRGDGQTAADDTPLSPRIQEGRQISADGRIAYASVNFSPDVDFGRASEIGAQIAGLAPDQPGLQVEIAGDSLAQFKAPESEFIGLAFRSRRADSGVRLGAGDGVADRSGGRRRRRRHGAHLAALEPAGDSRVRGVDRRDDRAWRRHRLRAVHRQSLPRRHPYRRRRSI